MHVKVYLFPIYALYVIFYCKENGAEKAWRTQVSCEF